MSRRVLTANRLRDGAVVYLGADGTWTTALTALKIAMDEAEAAALEAIGAAAAAAQHVVGPYLIEIEEAGGAVVPLRFRERIRAVGPSIHPELARQHLAG